MLKIALKNPPARTDDRTVNMDASEALLVTSDWSHEHATEALQAYLLLVMLAADGRLGPFSAADLYQRPQWTAPGHQTPDTTAEEFERGMHRLIELGVADAAPPDLKLV